MELRCFCFGTELCAPNVPTVDISGILYGYFADRPPQDPVSRVTILEHNHHNTEFTLLVESWDSEEEYYHVRVAVADLIVGQLWHTWILGRGHECWATQEGDAIRFTPDGVTVSWKEPRDVARTLKT